jgi:hypothetical protein
VTATSASVVGQSGNSASALVVRPIDDLDAVPRVQFAAAVNRGDGTVRHPYACLGVLGVAAVDRDDRHLGMFPVALKVLSDCQKAIAPQVTAAATATSATEPSTRGAHRHPLFIDPDLRRSPPAATRA